MSFDFLATELLLHIFRSCASVADVLNLALTCRRFQRTFASSQKLPILAQAAEAEYGPLRDIVQLVTQNASQPAHLIRGAPISMNLIQQMVEVGRVAKKWEEIYPIKKWKADYQNRRLLTDSERYLVRRAIYRLWLYCRSFHCPQYPRTSRMVPTVVRERAELLHNWTTSELAEIDDVRLVIREVVQNHICPSNGTIQRKFHKRHPDHPHGLSFNIHLNYPPPLSSNPLFSLPAPPLDPPTKPDNDVFFSYRRYTNNDNDKTEYAMNHPITRTNKYASKFRLDLYHEPGLEGWGDDIPHYYVVEDMLKLDPGQVLWLRENAPLKEQVERFVRSLGDWFDNNGETFAQTLECVLNDRVEDIGAFQDGILDGVLGVVKGVDSVE
jgi:hypothetical protein